jgi:hypothetical protein
MENAMGRRVVAVAVTTLVAFSLPAFAQGLADIARAAEAVRKEGADKPAVKVYTNEDLPAVEQHKAMLAEVARDEQAADALEEEARRAGVPPGWLRP